jgi:UDP-N-acetylmuramoyl-tripeptide--D-alanyl-D-alanine ligase
VVVSFPLDETALSDIEQRLAAGESLEAAIGSQLRTSRDASGALIIDDSGVADRDGMAAGLRFLAQVSGESTRSVAVLSEFDADESDALEEHDYIGRLVVRLNISQLVAVGHGARHIQSAAGLEGSWDGESLIVDTLPEAYDLLRGQLRENDVVLVKTSTRADLGSFADRAAGNPQ